MGIIPPLPMGTVLCTCMLLNPWVNGYGLLWVRVWVDCHAPVGLPMLLPKWACLFEDVTCGSWVGPRHDPVLMGGRWTRAPGPASNATDEGGFIIAIGGEGG